MKSLAFLTLLISVASAENLENPRVKVSNGILKGKVVKSAKGLEVSAFLGIPYAEPPVGSLRFKRPVLYQSEFKSDFDATKLPKTCSRREQQFYSILTREYITLEAERAESEDCLYLNIWVPKLAGPLQNILFVINGKSFPGINWFTGETLAVETNSIVVSCQYRLGVFGWLYLGTEDAPGNQGLLDQHLALEWVHKNIMAFRGNPDEVTLLSVNGGGASGSYHLLSPLSQPLFKRAVLSASVATSNWDFQPAIEAKEKALQIIKLTNCSNSEATAVDCLRKIDFTVLANLEMKLDQKNANIDLTPTVDNYFITDAPKNLLRNLTNTSKEILIGIALDEHIFTIPYVFSYVFSPFTSNSTINLPLLSLFRNAFQDYENKGTQGVSLNISNSSILRDSLLNEDFLISTYVLTHLFCPKLEFGNVWSKSGAAVYYYYFKAQAEYDSNGVLIGNQLQYIFGKPLYELPPYTNESKQLSLRMINVLSEFAKTGIAFNSWKANASNPFYVPNVNLWTNLDNFGRAQELSLRECTFWSELYQ